MRPCLHCSSEDFPSSLRRDEWLFRIGLVRIVGTSGGARCSHSTGTLVAGAPLARRASISKGETAAGAFPLNAVTIMRRICEEAEGVIEYDSLYLNLRLATMAKSKTVSGVESVCSSAVKSAIDAG